MTTPDLSAKVIKCDACGGAYPQVTKCRQCDHGYRKIPAMTDLKVKRMESLIDLGAGLSKEWGRELRALTYEYELHVPPTKHIGRH